jgi:glycerophosphoryl diester phosphodiesterase
MKRPRTLVFQHRTLSLDQLAEAERIGSDGVETDLAVCKDGVILVHPGPTGLELELDGRPLRDLTVDDISVITLERPVTLEAFLEAARGTGLFLDLEVKDPRVVPALGNLIDDLGERVIVTSFIPEVVSEAGRRYPKLQRGLLLGLNPAPISRRLWECFPSGKLSQTGANVVLPSWQLTQYARGLLGRTGGRRAIVWTANQQDVLDRLLVDRRVAGVITDNPQLALERRESARRSR